MERLTKKNSGGDYYYPKCYEKCSGNGTSEKCNECSFNYAICEKIGEYEDLEDRLNKVYGDCDGLLSKVVEMLEKHPCIDMADNTSKSRLLTDEDVDKWNEYKRLEEQDRLIKLPCRVGDTVYVKMAPYCKTHYAEAEVKDFVHFISCGFCIVVTSKYFDKQNIPFSEFNKTVFLTKPEAEAE